MADPTQFADRDEALRFLHGLKADVKTLSERVESDLTRLASKDDVQKAVADALQTITAKQDAENTKRDAAARVHPR